MAATGKSWARYGTPRVQFD